jgi:hypothetical protein
VYILIGADNTSLPYSSIPYGTDFPPRFSSVSWTDDRDVAITDCTFSKVAQVHTIYVDQAGRLGIVHVLTPISYSLNLTVHGTATVTIPDKTGTFSGTVGTCAVTVSGTVPGDTYNVNISSLTVCP